MSKECPCLGCVAPERHLGCHSTCDRYKTWKAEEAARKEKERAFKKAEADFIAVFANRRKR